MFRILFDPDFDENINLPLNQLGIKDGSNIQIDFDSDSLKSITFMIKHEDMFQLIDPKVLINDNLSKIRLTKLILYFSVNF